MFPLSQLYKCGKYLFLSYADTQSHFIDPNQCLDKRKAWTKQVHVTPSYSMFTGKMLFPPTDGYFWLCQVIKNTKRYISPHSDPWTSLLCSMTAPPPRWVQTRPAVVQRTPLSSAIWNSYVRNKTSEITIYQASWYPHCTQLTPLWPNHGFIGVEWRQEVDVAVT